MKTGFDWSLRHQSLMLVFTAATFVASIWLYIIIPKGFVPEQDTGLIAGVTDAAQDISFDNMSALQQKVADIIAERSRRGQRHQPRRRRHRECDGQQRTALYRYRLA